jgi:hypothetical protein
MREIDFILKIHFFPPVFAERGSPVDTFWIHVDPARVWEEAVRDAIDMLIEACVDKYPLVPRKKVFQRAMVFDIQDSLWEAVPKPASLRVSDEGEYE